ncbi:MAG: HAD family phosphatase [Bacteroidota bacterium]
MNPKAFLFDLNGTMIDDMSYHIHAWHRIFNRLGLDISLEKTKLECYGKNQEVLERAFPARFSEEEKVLMGFEKEKQYQEDFRPNLKLIDGLAEFLNKSFKKGIKMGIGSAAIMYNVDFVLEGLSIRHYFDAIVSADDVTISKPHPETFLKCAEELNVDPSECIVFEDSPKGVEAAQKAGMKAIVLTTMHAAEEFENYDNVLFCSPDYRTSEFQEVLSPAIK